MTAPFIGGCSSEPASPNATPDSPTETQNVEQPVLVVNYQDAKQVGAFNLTDQSGNEFTDKDLQGKLTIANFIFTRCPGTCPRQSSAMSELQSKLEAQKTDDVQLLTITVDPEFDTPAVLLEYGKSFKADFQRWSFLSGDKETTWEFSKTQLGMPVSDNPNDPLIPIAHESKFVLLDRRGKIRGYFDSLTEDGKRQLWSAIDVVLPEFQPSEALHKTHQFAKNVGHLAQPPGILNADWLTEQAAIEAGHLKDRGLNSDLRFEECGPQIGLTFDPQIVDDQRHRLLVNHYDHGNGVSVADVNGDQFLDIYFTSQVGPNELWIGNSEGSFSNNTTEAGVGLPDKLSVAASFADIDNDGDADLFVTSTRSGNVLMENQGNGTFIDITEQSGLAYKGHSSKGTFFDFNRDGLLDLFVANVGQFTTEEAAVVRQDETNSQPSTSLTYYVGRPDAFSGHLAPDLSECSRLYQNLGKGRFRDVTEEFDLQSDPSWSGDAIAFDANGDSWVDLYVCNMQGHDRLYLNQQGTGFRDATTEFFKATPWGTMGANVSDFDNNGLLDVFTTDMHSDMSVDVGPAQEKLKADIAWPEEFLKSEGRSIYGNAFFHQTTAGSFEEISDTINAENYWPWGLTCADLNADGFQDAFLTSSMCFPYRYGVNSLLLNDKGERFLDAHFTTGIEPRSSDEQIAPWFALDFDNEDSEHPLRMNRSGTWIVWSATGSRSSVAFDIDHDGDLDLVTNEFNSRPQVFRSNLDQSHPTFLKVRLQGTESNKDALGAVVSVSSGDSTQTQLHNGASGYLSQSLIPLYFGLNGQDQVDSIRIQWPNGKTQTVEGPIDSNQLLTIQEP